jgi:hypothetical protein
MNLSTRYLGLTHEYESLDQMRGSMSLARCPDPASFERGNYVRILQSWHRASVAHGAPSGVPS